MPADDAYISWLYVGNNVRGYQKIPGFGTKQCRFPIPEHYFERKITHKFQSWFTGNLGEVCDKYAAYMLQVAGAVDFDKMVFPYCAYRDGNLYYRLFCENCLFIENYSLI